MGQSEPEPKEVAKRLRLGSVVMLGFRILQFHNAAAEHLKRRMICGQFFTSADCKGENLKFEIVVASCDTKLGRVYFAPVVAGQEFQCGVSSIRPDAVRRVTNGIARGEARSKDRLAS
jgi:hypothetical protein